MAYLPSNEVTAFRVIETPKPTPSTEHKGSTRLIQPPDVSNTKHLIKLTDEDYAGRMPPVNMQPGRIPPESVWAGLTPSGSIPPGNVPSGRMLLRSSPLGSKLLGSMLSGSMLLGNMLLGNMLPGCTLPDIMLLCNLKQACAVPIKESTEGHDRVESLSKGMVGNKIKLQTSKGCVSNFLPKKILVENKFIQKLNFKSAKSI